MEQRRRPHSAFVDRLIRVNAAIAPEEIEIARNQRHMLDALSTWCATAQDALSERIVEDRFVGEIKEVVRSDSAGIGDNQEITALTEFRDFDR
ncbi:hypothetical protein LZK73_00920 [Neorhizobium galegae]|nr:hypothetical protein LZK73_00920 [Neorhizobium galegae]